MEKSPVEEQCVLSPSPLHRFWNALPSWRNEVSACFQLPARHSALDNGDPRKAREISRSSVAIRQNLSIYFGAIVWNGLIEFSTTAFFWVTLAYFILFHYFILNLLVSLYLKEISSRQKKLAIAVYLIIQSLLFNWDVLNWESETYGQWGTPDLWAKSRQHAHSYMSSMAVFILQQESWAVDIRLAKTKIFSVSSFTKKFADPWFTFSIILKLIEFKPIISLLVFYLARRPFLD